MDIIADILLAAGAIGAAFYCFVLSRRLRNLNDLEKGVGGAVAVLSGQVDDLRRTLDAARSQSDGNAQALSDLTERGTATAKRLELLMASLHDLPVQSEVEPPKPEAVSQEMPVSPEPEPVATPTIVREMPPPPEVATAPVRAEPAASEDVPADPPAFRPVRRSKAEPEPEQSGGPLFVRRPRKAMEAAE